MAGLLTTSSTLTPCLCATGSTGAATVSTTASGAVSATTCSSVALFKYELLMSAISASIAAIRCLLTWSTPMSVALKPFFSVMSLVSSLLSSSRLIRALLSSEEIDGSIKSAISERSTLSRSMADVSWSLLTTIFIAFSSSGVEEDMTAATCLRFTFWLFIVYEGMVLAVTSSR